MQTEASETKTEDKSGPESPECPINICGCNKLYFNWKYIPIWLIVYTIFICSIVGGKIVINTLSDNNIYSEIEDPNGNDIIDCSVEYNIDDMKTGGYVWQIVGIIGLSITGIISILVTFIYNCANINEACPILCYILSCGFCYISNVIICWAFIADNFDATFESEYSICLIDDSNVSIIEILGWIVFSPAIAGGCILVLRGLYLFYCHIFCGKQLS